MTHAAPSRRRRALTRTLAGAAVTGLLVSAPSTSTAADQDDPRAIGQDSGPIASPVTKVPAHRPWLARERSPEERAILLIGAMTLEEKVELMSGDQGAAPSAFYNAGIPRLGIPELRMADAGAGIAPRGWTLPGTEDRATAMPSTLALAATFDPDLAQRYAEVVAEEARQTGHQVLLGPNSDPPRQPFWGRLAESAGEDPKLNTSMIVPFVREVQSNNVIANLKHYTGYTQEVNRGVGQNSVISDRALHEVHTRTYGDAIQKADLGSVMCSFNKINGAYACEDDYSLDQVLRGDYGFRGFVLTDFGAIHSTEPSIRAGTDLETGTRAFYGDALLEAVRSGEVPEAFVDRAVLRILRTMFDIGVFDTDYSPSSIPVQSHGRVARVVQTSAITMLRNKDEALPFSDLDSGSVAVIGAEADGTSSLAGSANIFPTYTVSLLEGMRDRAAEEGLKVRYAEGNDPVNAANMLETRDMTAVPSSVLTPATGSGTGLTARHYGNTTFEGDPGVVRVERQALYDTGFTGGQPAFANLYESDVPAVPLLTPGLGGGQSVRYTGTITAPATGEYQLGLTGWGDARVFLDGRLVVDMTGEDGRRDVRSEPLALEEGTSYDLRVEYAGNRPLVPLQPGAFLLQWSTPAGAVAPSVREAARVAGRSDAAVVYVRTYETEERDRVSLKLPQNAQQLITQVAKANPRTVVVVASGGPVTMPWARKVPAVLNNYFGGQEEGSALTRVVFGKSPSGHLPVTIPRSEDDLPPGVDNPWETMGDLDVAFSEDVNIGYRGYLASGVRPRYEFGHGLSYTTFRYRNLEVSGLDATGRSDRAARVAVTVENTGDKAGAAVVQAYLGRLPGVDSPPRKLGGFDRVQLAAGEKQRVSIRIPRREFSYWDTAADGYVANSGRVAVHVGSSSSEIHLSDSVRVR